MLVAAGLIGTPVAAGPYIVLGPSDGIAPDQPRVQVEVIDASAPGGPRSLGPEFLNGFLLDTGATGILAAGFAATSLVNAGYETVAIFDEQGVAGFSPMNVSKSYQIDFAGDSGIRQTLPQSSGGVHMMLSTQLNFGSFGGIIGMPGMVNRVTSLDFTRWSGGNIDFLGTEFHSTVPAANSPRYNVPLTLVDFPHNGQRDPNDPLPTFAPLPFVPVKMTNRGNSITTQFIVDTGAQLSIISTQTAEALGINVAAETIDYLPVGGIGGEVLMPLVPAEALGVLTGGGPELRYTDLQVGVLDIDPGIPGLPSIPGIFGMEFLTSGWLLRAFGVPGPDGFLEHVHFDFRDAANMQGTMVMDINPDLNVVYYEGDVNGDGTVDIFDVAMISAHWGGGLGSPGDANGDGMVDIFDVATVSNDWGQASGPQGAAAVPEPATGALAAVGAAIVAILSARRRLRRSLPRVIGTSAPRANLRS